MRNWKSAPICWSILLTITAPGSPTNENTNGLLHQCFPKGTDLSQYSQKYMTKVANEMNNQPRKSLGFRTQAEVMAQKIGDLNGSVALQN